MGLFFAKNKQGNTILKSPFEVARDSVGTDVLSDDAELGSMTKIGFFFAGLIGVLLTPLTWAIHYLVQAIGYLLLGERIQAEWSSPAIRAFGQPMTLNKQLETKVPDQIGKDSLNGVAAVIEGLAVVMVGVPLMLILTILATLLSALFWIALGIGFSLKKTGEFAFNFLPFNAQNFLKELGEALADMWHQVYGYTQNDEFKPGVAMKASLFIVSLPMMLFKPITLLVHYLFEGFATLNGMEASERFPSYVTIGFLIPFAYGEGLERIEAGQLDIENNQNNLNGPAHLFESSIMAPVSFTLGVVLSIVGLVIYPAAMLLKAGFQSLGLLLSSLIRSKSVLDDIDLGQAPRNDHGPSANNGGGQQRSRRLQIIRKKPSTGPRKTVVATSKDEVHAPILLPDVAEGRIADSSSKRPPSPPPSPPSEPVLV